MKAWPFAASLLAAVMVGLFFTDLSLYGYETRLLPPPVAFFAAFGGAVALLASFRPRMLLAFGASAYTLWLFLFLAVSLAWFFRTIQNGEYWAFLRLRLYSLGFLTTCLLLLSAPEARRTARAVLALAVVLGAALNLVDLCSPLTFSPFLGRSTGLYLNPNVSGAALALGALAAWEGLPVRVRAPFYGVVLLGVLPTFSRSALLLALLLGPALCWTGHLGWKAWGAATLAAAGAAAGGAALLLASGWIPVDSSVMQDLLLRATLSSQDYSTEDRFLLLREALAMIAASPWTGHGTGASYLWTLDRSSHNAYLNLMVDHGFWGCLLVPALFLTLARGTLLCGLYIGAWLILGFVSHNLLDEASWLVLLAFTPYLGETSP